MTDAELREKTKRTAAMLFHDLPGGTGFETWRKFDRHLARELSMFFTGTLYSREVIFQQVTYGGMPVVVDALEVFKGVLVERGEWED